MYLGNDSLLVMIIQRTNAHCGAGLPTGISVTYECIDGVDSLAPLLEGVRFTGSVHYLIEMTINYVNHAVDKHIFIILLFHYITLRFLAHMLGFAEAQHSTNKGNHTVLLCLDVGRTFSAVIED